MNELATHFKSSVLKPSLSSGALTVLTGTSHVSLVHCASARLETGCSGSFPGLKRAWVPTRLSLGLLLILEERESIVDLLREILVVGDESLEVDSGALVEQHSSHCRSTIRSVDLLDYWIDSVSNKCLLVLLLVEDCHVHRWELQLLVLRQIESGILGVVTLVVVPSSSSAAARGVLEVPGSPHIRVASGLFVVITTLFVILVCVSITLVSVASDNLLEHIVELLLLLLLLFHLPVLGGHPELYPDLLHSDAERVGLVEVLYTLLCAAHVFV